MSYDILIVDDSKTVLFMLEKILNLCTLSINLLLTAANGKEAIERLEENRVDLIMLDINMPVMNGLQLIRFLKKSASFKDIPLIVISAEGREKYREETNRLGVAGYIKKPFQPEQIKKLILEILGVENNDRENKQSETCDF
ncbi:MAG: response regulator [bacterium]|nr:response regulator [bacterium]